MIDERKTLGELLSDPRIGKIAPDAIRNRDLSKEEAWGKTPAQLRDEHFFFGDIGRGFGRLFDAADTGDWYYPLYSDAECAEDEARRNVNMVWWSFPISEVISAVLSLFFFRKVYCDVTSSL